MLADDPALLAACLDESRDSLAGLESSLIALDDSSNLRADVEAIFRPVHTLKGNAPFFGFMEIQRLAHALETVLDLLRKAHLLLSKALTDVLLAGLDGALPLDVDGRFQGAALLGDGQLTLVIDPEHMFRRIDQREAHV